MSLGFVVFCVLLYMTDFLLIICVGMTHELSPVTNISQEIQNGFRSR